jgi:hypothetical protein
MPLQLLRGFFEFNFSYGGGLFLRFHNCLKVFKSQSFPFFKFNHFRKNLLDLITIVDLINQFFDLIQLLLDQILLKKELLFIALDLYGDNVALEHELLHKAESKDYHA